VSIRNFLRALIIPKMKKTCPYCKLEIVGQRWSPSTPIDELEYLCFNNNHEYRLVYKKEKLLFVQMTFPHINKYYLLSIDYHADFTSLEQIIWNVNTFDYLPVSLQEIEVALPFDVENPIVSGSHAMRRVLNLAVFS